MTVRPDPFDAEAKPLANSATTERVPEFPMDLVPRRDAHDDGRPCWSDDEIIDDRLGVQKQAISVLQIIRKPSANFVHRVENEFVRRLSENLF